LTHHFNPRSVDQVSCGIIFLARHAYVNRNKKGE
jgi:hypothetical protein